MPAIKVWRVLIVATVVGVSLAVPHGRVARVGETVLHVEPASTASDGLGDAALIRCRDLDQQAAIDGGCLDIWDRNFQRLLGDEVPETAVVLQSIAMVPSGRAR
jgi:conjugative transfer region protein TrbK